MKQGIYINRRKIIGFKLDKFYHKHSKAYRKINISYNKLEYKCNYEIWNLHNRSTLGNFGVLVKTHTSTPCFWGHWVRAWVSWVGAWVCCIYINAIMKFETCRDGSTLGSFESWSLMICQEITHFATTWILKKSNIFKSHF